MKFKEIPSLAVKLGRKNGATDVAASVASSENTMIRFSNNEVTAAKVFMDVITNVFVAVKEKRAGVTISDVSRRALEDTVRKLVKIAKTSPPGEVYAPMPRGPFKYDRSLLKPTKLPRESSQLVDYVEDAVGAALEAGAERVAGVLTAGNSRTILKTSGRASGSYENSTLEISVRSFASDVATGHSTSIASREEDFAAAEAGRESAEIARRAIRPEPGSPGRYTALLSPLIFADLVEEVGRLSSAFMVDAGLSFLGGKIGSSVARKGFTLVDDPTLSLTYGSRPFDDEGVPSRKSVIIEDGLLKTHLHNSVTAKKFNTKTTGNAGLIIPTPWNLVIEPGNKSFDQMISQIENGIYVTNDWYLRYQNYGTGDFSTIPRDGMFLIKNGEIVKAIRDLRISDNMLRIFQNIDMLSRERKWIKWWEVETPTLTPYAVVRELNFTKSTM